jgi:Rod binding domain-containing protein
MLKQAANEVLGSVFFAPMLKIARDNPLKGKYGHGGRGEEVFGAQLDMELARQASHRLDGGLADALVRSLSKPGSAADATAVRSDQASSASEWMVSGTD